MEMEMQVPEHVLLESEFFLLIILSLVAPVVIFIYLYRRTAISRFSVIAYAWGLIAIAAIDFYLLQSLAEQAKATVSGVDDGLFSSGLSVALYVLPAVFAGIGVNLLSHILIDHLHKAEARYSHETHRP